MRTISCYVFRMILLGLTMLALALILANKNVWAVDPTKEPAILVANKNFVDNLYGKTVLVVVPVGDGHFGLILNRPTKILLSDLFPEHEPSKGVTDPVYLGGPVRSDVVFAIVKAPESPGEGSFPLMSNVWFVTNANTVDRVIEKRGNNARYIAGFVIWKPGELAKEMKQELWHVEDPNAELIFKKDTTELWKELEKKHRVRGLST